MSKSLSVLLCFCLFITGIAYGQTNATITESNRLLSIGKASDAFALVRKEAVKGNSVLQYQLGLYYQQGVGTTKNDSIANIWFLKAANQANVDAQKIMGFRLMEGIGQKKNTTKALEMFKKCAPASEECYLNMINCYNLGIGTPKDPFKAVTLAKDFASKKFKVNTIYVNEIVFFIVEKYMIGDGPTLKMDKAEAMKWILFYNEHLDHKSDPNSAKLKSYFKNCKASLSDQVITQIVEQVKLITKQNSINYENLK